MAAASSGSSAASAAATRSGSRSFAAQPARPRAGLVDDAGADLELDGDVLPGVQALLERVAARSAKRSTQARTANR